MVINICLRANWTKHMNKNQRFYNISSKSFSSSSDILVALVDKSISIDLTLDSSTANFSKFVDSYDFPSNSYKNVNKLRCKREESAELLRISSYIWYS